MSSLNPNLAAEMIDMAVNLGLAVEPLEKRRRHLLLGPAETALYCGVTVQTVAKWRREGTLRAHIVGSRFRYRVSDLLRYIKEAK